VSVPEGRFRWCRRQKPRYQAPLPHGQRRPGAKQIVIRKFIYRGLHLHRCEFRLALCRLLSNLDGPVTSARR
jgi:hypothetical protein